MPEPDQHQHHPAPPVRDVARPGVVGARARARAVRVDRLAMIRDAADTVFAQLVASDPEDPAQRAALAKQVAGLNNKLAWAQTGQTPGRRR